jgi:hypothetical protein
MTRLHVLLSILLCAAAMSAQNLPSEMRISNDGKRLVLGGNPSEGFYDESALRTIHLQFSQPNYWQLMQANYQSGADIPASMTVDGATYDSVGVRFRGQTSFFANNTQKKSFNITLDYVKDGQKIMGYEALNLNCGFQDPSSIREVLYNHFGRHYTPGLKSNFVLLTLNGQNWGPYANVQQIDGTYLREWFLSNKGTRWRALKTTGGPGFGAGTSTLNYLGPDTASYTPHYTLKKTYKDNPWEDLVRACDKLNNLPISQLDDSLKYYLDVDRALWFLAHEIIWTDEDSYVWKGGMDYYVYWEPETDRLFPLEYDGNSCIRPNAVTWSPFYKELDVKYPLMNRLFASPPLRQRYLAHVRTILQEHMQPTQVHAKIDQYVALIGAHVEADPKKIYPYNQFLNDITLVKNWIVNRRNFLLNHPEVNVAGLTVSDVEFEGEIAPGQAAQVRAKVSGAMGVNRVNLYYSPGVVGVFERILMHDDGQHGDGAAGDGVYGASVPGFGAGSYVRFYIEAIANNGPKTATYEPQGAEHDVYFYRVGAAGAGDVVINELMASNSSTAADQNGEYDDWIELYNNTALPVDLSGYYLSDNPANMLKWEFPDGAVIEPNGYLIVWADEDGSQAGLHANFKLSADGEELYLSDPDGNALDEVIFPTQTTDMGYARAPNGTGEFVIQASTFNANNDLSGVAEVPGGLRRMKVFPNPAREEISIEVEEYTGPLRLQIADLLGRVVWTQELSGRETIVPVRQLAAGAYFVRVEGMRAELVWIGD